MGKIQNVIYILTNPQYPEYIKIGYASDLKARLSSLDTGTMSSFIPYAVYKTQLSVADKQLHRIIGLLNPKLRATKFKNGKKSEREFFKLDPEEAYELLKCIAKISGTLNCLYKIDANGKLIPDSECNQTIPGQSPAQKPQTIPPKPVPKNHAPIPDGIYHTKHKIKAAGISITATMEVKNENIILKAGSLISPVEGKGLQQNIKDIRKTLNINNNKLVNDLPCDSINIAAGVALGASANAWVEWLTENNEPIKIFQKQGGDMNA